MNKYYTEYSYKAFPENKKYSINGEGSMYCNANCESDAKFAIQKEVQKEIVEEVGYLLGLVLHFNTFKVV